jgi:hypothetical protein
MVDITLISTALTSLKAATDIAKFLRESDLSLEKAELKLKLADLISSLADAKIQVVEIQEALQEKDKKIQELEDAFQSKDILVRRYDAYYNSDPNGQPVGVPYCLRCWENEHKKRQLVNDAGDRHTRICTTCGHRYSGRLAEAIQASPESESA